MTNYPYVELDRRFIDIGSSDPEDDPRTSMLLSARDNNIGIRWQELFENDAAIILGSAGSGKTREICKQADLLRSKGIPAFVLRLESLCRQSVEQSFTDKDPGGPMSFDSWKKSGGEAIAFLDALDEARLPKAENQRTLADALSHVSAGVGKLGKSLKIVITTRGSEWQGESDLDLVITNLRLLRNDEPQRKAKSTVEPKTGLLPVSRTLS